MVQIHFSSSNLSRKGIIRQRKWSSSFNTGLAITFERGFPEFVAPPDPFLWQVLSSTKGKSVRKSTTIRQPIKHITHKRNATNRFRRNSLIFYHDFWLSNDKKILRFRKINLIDFMFNSCLILMNELSLMEKRVIFDHNKVLDVIL